MAAAGDAAGHGAHRLPGCCRPAGSTSSATSSKAARHAIDVARDSRARDRAVKAVGNLQDRFEMEGGYRAEAEAKPVAAGLGLPSEKLDRP